MSNRQSSISGLVVSTFMKFNIWIAPKTEKRNSNGVFKEERINVLFLAWSENF